MNFVDKHRKTIFFILVGVIFLAILAYNFFTPFLSDDLTFTYDVRKATGIGDLFVQQWGDYNGHNGRFVGQLCIRFSLWFGMGFFNVMNSLMFTALVLIMYGFIGRRRRYDIPVLLLCLTFLWIFPVCFGQTMLWTSGACNYLWGSVFIFGFCLLYRTLLKSEMRNPAENPKTLHGTTGAAELSQDSDKDRNRGKLPQILKALGMLIFAVIAGWCSENTSGGALLFVIILTANYLIDMPKGKRRIPLYAITSVVGLTFGLIMMIRSPGNAQRADLSADAENYDGIMKYFSHIYKVTVSMKNLFLPLLIIITIALVILVATKQLQRFKSFRNSSFIQYIFIGMATSYALILVTLPPDRAFFGAGVFFMIAAIEGIVRIFNQKEESGRSCMVIYALAAVMCLLMFFDYFENLVNLARIKREEDSRISMIQEAIDRGENTVVIPNYHPEFNNRFTTAYDAETCEDPEFWINGYYEEYMGIDNVIALPYEEWEEIYGKWE